MAYSIQFDLKVAIPHNKIDGDRVDGGVCVYLPNDARAWKESLAKHLEGNEEMYLTITDRFGDDFALIFSSFPDENLADGLERGKLFGFTMRRKTLEALGRAIQFALQESTISTNSE